MATIFKIGDIVTHKKFFKNNFFLSIHVAFGITLPFEQDYNFWFKTNGNIRGGFPFQIKLMEDKLNMTNGGNVALHGNPLACTPTIRAFHLQRGMFSVRIFTRREIGHVWRVGFGH